MCALAVARGHGVSALVGFAENLLGVLTRLGRRDGVDTPDPNPFSAAVFHVIAHDPGGLDAEDEPLEPGVPDLEGLGAGFESLEEAVADDGLHA